MDARDEGRSREFGQVLLELRLGLGWNQQRMATGLDRTRSWLSKVENGAHLPTLDEFGRHLRARIVAACGESGAGLAEKALHEDHDSAWGRGVPEAAVRRITDPDDPGLSQSRRLLEQRLPAEVPEAGGMRRALSRSGYHLWVAEDPLLGQVVSALSFEVLRGGEPLVLIGYWVVDDTHRHCGVFSEAVIAEAAARVSQLVPGCVGALLEVAIDKPGHRRDPWLTERARSRLFARVGAFFGWDPHELNVPVLTPEGASPAWRTGPAGRRPAGSPVRLMYMSAPGAKGPIDGRALRDRFYERMRSVVAPDLVAFVNALEAECRQLDRYPEEFALMRDAYLAGDSGPYLDRSPTQRLRRGADRGSPRPPPAARRPR